MPLAYAEVACAAGVPLAYAEVAYAAEVPLAYAAEVPLAYAEVAYAAEVPLAYAEVAYAAGVPLAYAEGAPLACAAGGSGRGGTASADRRRTAWKNRGGWACWCRRLRWDCAELKFNVLVRRMYT